MAVMKIRNLEVVGSSNPAEIDTSAKKASLLFETVVGQGYPNSEGITGRSVTLGMLDGFLAEDGTALDGSIKTKVAAEASLRTEADAALGVRIDEEAAARGNADTALGGRIDAEALARGNADTALGLAIAAEETRAKNIEGGLREDVDKAAEDIEEINNKIGLEADGSLPMLPGGEASLTAAINFAAECLANHEEDGFAHENIKGDDESIQRENLGASGVFSVKDGGITTAKIKDEVITFGKLAPSVKQRIETLEQLGSYVGKYIYASQAAIPTDSTDKTAFPHGVTPNDYVYAYKGNEVYQYIASQFEGTPATVIVWAESVLVEQDITGKADKSDLEAHKADTENPHEVTAEQVGLGNVDNTSDEDKPISDATQAALDLKADAADLAAHEADTENPHEVTAEQVGLGNVDNTSDMDKPVSAAMQIELVQKQDSLSSEAMIFIEAFAAAFQGLADGEYKLVVFDGQVSFEPIA